MITDERIAEIIVEHCNGSRFESVKRAIKQAIEEAASADARRIDAIESGFSLWVESTKFVATDEWQNDWFVQYSINCVVSARSLRKALDAAIVAHNLEIN